jgi:hypothetical protein
VGRTTATFPQQGQQNGLPDVKNSVFFTLMLKCIYLLYPQDGALQAEHVGVTYC